MVGMIGRLMAVSLAMLPAAWPASGQQSFDAAAAFGAREDVSDVSLSPDGKLLAMIGALAGGTSRVMVVPVAGGTPQTVLTAQRGQRLSRCDWSAATRIVCRVYMAQGDSTLLFSVTRMFAVDADGKNLRQLTSPQSGRALDVAYNGGSVVDLLPDENNGDVLMTRMIIPETTIGTRLAEQSEGMTLERLNTRTLARRNVETARQYGVEFITDGHGVVRVIGDQPPATAGYSARYVRYCYRLAGDKSCKPLSTVTDEDVGFNPYVVDRDLNVVYGFDKHEGRLALFRIALDGSLKRELVLADPNVDVDGLIRIGRQRRVVGASFATERRQAVMFDPELKALSAKLARALPKLPSVAIIDATTDESKLLIVASSDDDPGRYYLYDKATRELNELVHARPPLVTVKLATVKPVTFPAADGTIIPGYLTLPPGSDGRNLPAIVMPHGGPGARDEWGFDWWAQFFANRGYAVLQPNFRGSTGYGDAWFQKNGYQSWRIAIGDVNDGGRWLLKQGIAASGKLAIVGWSYGGYAALQSSVLDPDLFKAIIAVAPVTDLNELRETARSYTNFKSVDARIGNGPHVREGSPAQNAARIKAPVLMFHGDKDLNVAIQQAKLMEGKLRGAGKAVELVTYPGLDHQLDDTDARTDMLRKSDAFLRKSLGL